MERLFSVSSALTVSVIFTSGAYLVAADQFARGLTGTESGFWGILGPLYYFIGSVAGFVYGALTPSGRFHPREGFWIGLLTLFTAGLSSLGLAFFTRETVGLSRLVFVVLREAEGILIILPFAAALYGMIYVITAWLAAQLGQIFKKRISASLTKTS